MATKSNIPNIPSNAESIDRAQLEFNLSLTPQQRIEYHQSALDLIWELGQAKSSDEAESQ